MSNLYEFDLSADEMRTLVRGYKDLGRNWPGPTKVYPNQEAPVIRTIDGERAPATMRWGFPHWTGKGPVVTNFRNPRAATWKRWVDDPRQRCVVPARAFSEPDRNTAKPVQWRWFERPGREPFCFAGIWRPWTGDRGTKAAPLVGDHLLYSIMTTEPNRIVAPIHKKAMPVMLTSPAEIEQWLEGSVTDALALQKPVPEDAILMADS
jgi:putative SOS response-associated peptidase YedK